MHLKNYKQNFSLLDCLKKKKRRKEKKRKEEERKKVS
jgi:hypothetical protein